MATPPSPLGEAVERLANAAQAYLDGPVAFLRAAADRATQPGYDADSAAADATGYGLRLAQAWFGGLNAMVDAIAVAAMPPDDGQRFVVTVTGAKVLRNVSIKSKTWTWQLDKEPPDIVIAVHPPLGLQPNATHVGMVVKPSVLEPSWDVELELSPVGKAGGTIQTVSLDATSELRPGAPWPMNP